jgi:pyruvate dehydrogenase E1 component beta subunit
MESVFSRVPGLVVVAPSTPYDAKGLLKSSIRCDDPVIFLESEKMLAEKGEVPNEEYLLPIGKALVERQGADVTLVSYGRPLQRIVRPAVEHLLADHGIDVELIDLRTLRPLDVETIARSVEKTNRCVIVDEDWGYCGMGSGILYKIQKRCFDDLDAPVEYVHSDEIPVPFSHPLEEAMLPSVDRIVSAVKEACYR